MSEYLPPASPQTSPQEKRPGRGWQRVLLIFGIALFAAASIYIAFIVATWADNILFPGNQIDVNVLGLPKLPGADNPPPEVGTLEDRINVLVLGLDRRPWEPEDGPTRTDTILVFTVDPFSGSAGIFSIPRDLIVQIPNLSGGYFQERANVAYEYGSILRHPKGRAGLVVDTIEHNFGIKIDYYVVADFLDFVNVIDAIGGIDIDVPKPLASWYSIDDLPEHHVWMEFPVGRQHMDGNRALAYARIRAGSDDLDRIKRQQQVMVATLAKVLDAKLFLQARSLWEKFNKAVDTNIPAVKVPGLALLAKKISLDKVTAVSLGEAVVDCDTTFGAAVLCAVPGRVEELKRQVFFDPRLRSESAVIEIQNGTDRPALTNNVVRHLVKQGVVEADLVTGNAAAGSYQGQTVIFDLTGKKYTAEKVAEWLGIPKERIRNGPDASGLRSETTADIVIIVGADARVPSS